MNQQILDITEAQNKGEMPEATKEGPLAGPVVAPPPDVRISKQGT